MGSKHSLLIKFGQFMSYSKRNNFIKNFYKSCLQKTSSRLFCVSKELSTTSIVCWTIEYLKIFNSKTIIFSPNQHAGLCRFLITENSLKIKKGLELVTSLHFSYNFFDKRIYFVMLLKLAKFHYQTVFTSQIIR